MHSSVRQQFSFRDMCLSGLSASCFRPLLHLYGPFVSFLPYILASKLNSHCKSTETPAQVVLTRNQTAFMNGDNNKSGRTKNGEWRESETRLQIVAWVQNWLLQIAYCDVELNSSGAEGAVGAVSFLSSRLLRTDVNTCVVVRLDGVSSGKNLLRFLLRFFSLVRKYIGVINVDILSNHGLCLVRKLGGCTDW